MILMTLAVWSLEKLDLHGKYIFGDTKTSGTLNPQGY